METTPLNVNRLELLRFMNEVPEDASGHHTALTSFLGEPLAARLDPASPEPPGCGGRVHQHEGHHGEAEGTEA